MAELATHTISAAGLRDFVAAIFRHAGCEAGEAAEIGLHLVSANLTGHDSHGVIRVPRYIEDIQTERTLIGQTVTVISESATHAVLDGKYGFGQHIGPQAVAIGVAKARKEGLSMVALRRSAHIGRIGGWAEMAADEGLISIHFVNVDNYPMVAPFGGVARRFSTNPVTIGVPPMAGRAMLLLDMATSIVAEGKVMVASNGGKPVPEGAMITPEGQLSTDPETLYGPLVPNGPRNSFFGKGALRAFGEHKGSGLAFMCEILGGVLTGGYTSGPLHDDGRQISNGMFSIYLDPLHFGCQDFVRKTMEYVDYVKSSPTAEGCEEVLYPGEPEARYRAVREKEGIPLQVDTWTNLCNIAKGFGIAIPA
jgi:uncharacterized oxidoreductase